MKLANAVFGILHDLPRCISKPILKECVMFWLVRAFIPLQLLLGAYTAGKDSSFEFN